MSSNSDRSSPGKGMAFAAVVLVLAVIAAIWYFQSTGESDNGGGEVTITIDPNADPGTETTIVP